VKVGDLVYWIEELGLTTDSPVIKAQTIEAVSDKQLRLKGYGPEARRKFSVQDGIPTIAGYSRLGSACWLFADELSALKSYARYADEKQTQAQRDERHYQARRIWADRRIWAEYTAQHEAPKPKTTLCGISASPQGATCVLPLGHRRSSGERSEHIAEDGTIIHAKKDYRG
jgi:hypothetical protein